MTSTIPAPPASLKALLPFIQRSQELRQASPPMAYWALYHALQQGIPSLSSKGDPAAKAYLLTLMDTTEALKKDLVEKGHKEVQSDNEARVFVRGFAEKVFSGADKEDREGRAGRSTAKAFLAASNFIQILQDLEEGNKLDDEMASKLKYSKWKAADIAKALREGRKPAAGPVGADEDPSLLDPSAGVIAGGEPSLALPESKEEKEYVEREMRKLMEGANIDAAGGGGEGPSTPTPASVTGGEEDGVVHALSPAVATPDSPSASRRMQSRLSYDGSSSIRSPPGSVSGGDASAASSRLGTAVSPGLVDKSPNFSMPLHPQLGIVTGSVPGSGSVPGDEQPSTTDIPPSTTSYFPPPSAGASSTTTFETDEGSMWRKDMPTPVEENAASASGFDAYTTRVPSGGIGSGMPFATPATAAQQQQVGATLGVAPPHSQHMASPGSRPLPTPGLSPSLGGGGSGFQPPSGSARGLPIPPGETAPGSGPTPPPWAASLAAAAAASGGTSMAPSLSGSGSATSGTPGLSLGLGLGGVGASKTEGMAPLPPPAGSAILNHGAPAPTGTPSAPPLISSPPHRPGISSPFPLPSQPSAPPALAPAPSAPAPAPAVLPTTLPAASIARAQKLGRWAVSALDYEDLDTARKHLRAALEIVEGRGEGGKN